MLGSGCLEREGGRPDTIALDFWVSVEEVDDALRRVATRLGDLGIDALLSAEPQDDGWRRAMRAFHRPVPVARTLMVRPPWSDPDPGLLDVVIDPGMAFGTAQHGTTRACLEMLCRLPRGGSLLDVGCGSGVLAIAARRLGFDPVRAIDFDPLAVEATLANARRNGVGIAVARRTVGPDRLEGARVLMANLTLTVLEVLAGALPHPPPDHMIISGLRPEEVDRAGALFVRAGFAERERVEDDGWSTVRLDRAR